MTEDGETDLWLLTTRSHGICGESQPTYTHWRRRGGYDLCVRREFSTVDIPSMKPGSSTEQAACSGR